MSDNRNGSGGIGFFGLLQVAFIVLKILDKIDWSWWVVLLPSIISVSLFLIIFIVVLIIYIIQENS